jgi:Glycosyl transferase family 90
MVFRRRSKSHDLYSWWQLDRAKHYDHFIVKILCVSCFTLACVHVLISIVLPVCVLQFSSRIEENATLWPQRNTLFTRTNRALSATIQTKPIYAYDRRSRQHPRWGETVEDEQRYGMDFGPVLDFIVNSSSAAYLSQQANTHLKDTRYVSTTDHMNDVGGWLPETLYVIDGKGLWTSRRHQDCNAYGRGILKDKVIPIGNSVQSALQYLQSEPEETCKLWPRLCRTIYNDDDSTSGFPYLAYFSDFTGCNFHNYKGEYSVPLFTAAVAVECNHAFALPTHEILEMIKSDPQEWDEFFAESQLAYPWDSKLFQVVWRGALTGPYVNETYKNTRWHTLRTLHTIKKEFVKLGNAENLFLFDVGAVRLPPRKANSLWKNSLHEVGGLVPPIDPMSDFQKYRAVLDLDGNSWSSRFNLLLCYNAVVIKVEPTWVDMLYFKKQRDDQSQLEPWKHYIPAKADLSDLFEKASFVLDPANDEFLKNMIGEANTWCRNNLVKRSIDSAILDTFERYVELIDIGNPDWRKQQWRSAKGEIFAPNSQLRMELVPVSSDGKSSVE